MWRWQLKTGCSLPWLRPHPYSAWWPALATFAITLEPSRHLRTPNTDASRALNMVTVRNASERIQILRDKFDTDVYDVAVIKCSSHGIEVSTPRVVGRQVHCGDAPAENPRDHYRRNVWLLLIDGAGRAFPGRRRCALTGPVTTLERLLPARLHADLEKVLRVAATIRVRHVVSKLPAQGTAQQEDALGRSATVGALGKCSGGAPARKL